ncbi:hypothetical protein [Paenibacillus sp. Y412MC10]|nr:hypothetical protein [Paenibacillus sp. Y412MC10]
MVGVGVLHSALDHVRNCGDRPNTYKSNAAAKGLLRLIRGSLLA